VFGTGAYYFRRILHKETAYHIFKICQEKGKKRHLLGHFVFGLHKFSFFSMYVQRDFYFDTTHAILQPKNLPQSLR